jgi:hypothetical protein
VLGSAKPECAVRHGRKTLAKPERFGAQVRRTANPVRGTQDASSSRGSSQTSVLPSRIRPRGIRQTGLPRSVGQSHRPAGSWAYDHGVAAHLSCNASIRVTMLLFVSAFDILTRPVRSIRGWPYLRLRELRVCAAKLVFARQSSDCQRTSVRTPLFGAAPHRLRSRGRRSPRARHSGKVFG